MLTSAALSPMLVDLLGRVLVHLGSPEPSSPADLGEQLRIFQRLKAERGRKAIAEALGLNEAELPAVDAALRDVERTGGRLAGGDASAERNAVLAQMKLLSWFETIGQRVPELALEPQVEAAVSEDVGRKQVRALELILRSLITESYGDQEHLIARLREALNEKVVKKWEAGADTGDILSGCTFSELASLFVNKEEFERYESLYEDTPFLTLLKQRRRTIQSFLDDIRRIRNVLAHNKHITNIQLSLLDLYYEEIVTPVQTAFDEGEVRVDPAVHLDASKEEIERYVEGIHEDVQSVKDDLAELKSSVMASLGALEASSARIEDTTRGISRKMLYAGAALVVLIGATIFLVMQGGDTQATVDATHAAAQRTEAATQETSRDLGRLQDGQRELAGLTRESTEASREVAEGVGKATEEMKRGSEVLAEATAATREAARDMSESTERVVQTLEELRKGFAALTQTGGIIAKPRRPQEHYHNARLYEQRGDYPKAMQSYRAFFTFDELEFVDPHLRFQSFLKLQRGVPGAREVYFELKRGSKNLAMAYAWNLLLEGEARAKGLDGFLEANPEFAPAVYARSRDFSLARLGTQSMADKRREKALLTRFLALKQEGSFLHYYLDQTVAAAQVADAEERLAVLSTIADEVLENPVQLSASRSNQGWSVIFSISDTVKEIFYRLGTEGEFKSTGFVPGIRSQAGLPLPRPNIQLGGSAKKTLIQVKYSDPRGEVHGPFDLVFDPDVMLLQGTKNILGMTKNSWLTFRDMGEDKVLMYFSHLMSYRSALQEIRYGLDRDEPDVVHPFSPADPKNPYAVNPNDKLYVDVPAETKYATIQLTYKDGTKSEIVRIDR